MSSKLINKTIEDLGIDDFLKIFYDFNDYSGNHINSIDNGLPDYSGQVINYDSNFNDVSGSGLFNNQYISIQNHSGITEESATIIFSYEKTGISNGVIFSHMDPGGPSGWEVGINQGNKLYFKNFINGSPSYQTLNHYLYDKNLCAITVSRLGIGELFRLNFEKPLLRATSNFKNTVAESSIVYHDFDKSSFNVPAHTISNGSEWRVGSGEFSYQGYMDCFMYFDHKLNIDQLQKIAYSLHSDFTINPAVSGVITGEVTGHELIIQSGVSGQTGNIFVPTGSGIETGIYTYESGSPVTGTVGVSGLVYVPYRKVSGIEALDQQEQNIYKTVTNLSNIFDITGGIKSTGLSNYQSSGSYWHFSGNSGAFNGQSAIGPPGEIFGITGFDVVTVTGYLTGRAFTGYESQANTGLLYNVYSKSGLRRPNRPYKISGESISYAENRDPSYYANAISLKDDSSEEYFYELMYDADEFQSINNSTYNYLYQDFGKYISHLEEPVDPHELNYTINGVSYFTGSLEYSKNEYNKLLYNVTSGFYVDGDKILTEVNLNLEDRVLFDIIYSGDKQSLTINNTADYANRPFSSFNIENNDIFLNGIKIYSGIDYIDSGGFYPINNSTGITGFYFTYPKYSGVQVDTGIIQGSIKIEHDKINPNSYLLYFNGVRQNKKSILPHAKHSDLISGVLENKNKNLIYQMKNGVKVL